MVELQYFHFIRPYWLVAIIPLLIVTVLFLKRKLISRSWQSVIDARLLPFILTGQEGHKAKWPVYVFALAGLLIIVAMAGPAWEKLPQPVYRSQSGLVIVLDMSQSMDATDIKPSRITRAKHKIMDILAKRIEGQTALVVYASEAFVVSPLSDDVKTIESLVTSLSTELMPRQGSHPLQAIEKAVDLLKQGGMHDGNILLITDGLGADDETSIADSLAGTSYRLSVLAVGTAGGAPVQLGNGSLLKDRFGDIVIPKLQEQPLRNLANRTSGRYTVLTATDKDINYLSRGFEFSPVSDNAQLKTAQTKTKQSNLQADTWREEGPWLLLLIAPFVALGFRKGWLGALVICTVLPLPQTSHAFSWDELWQNQNQRAQAALEHGKPEQAAQQFKDKKWQSAAYYKAKDYEKSLKLLENSNSPEDMYNKGNALARLGRIEEAIKAYNSVLNEVPGHEDAAYNKELLEKLLKQQQSQQGQSDQQKQGNQQNDQQNQQQSQQQDKQQGQQSQQNQQGSQQQQADSAQQQDQSGQQEDGAQQAQQEQNQQNQSSAQNAKQDDSTSDDSMNQQQAMSDKNKNDQGENKDAQTALQQDQKENDEDQQGDQQQMTQQNQQQMDNVDQAELEELQANEQWLRRIPDDPGGLLRRKFRYQSQLNQQEYEPQSKDEEPW
jgi:Ca-activated chloride channel family protein